MGYRREPSVFVLYLAFISLAEAVTVFMDPSLGLFMHSLLFVSLLGLSALWRGFNPASNLFLGLSLAPITRILSLSFPLSYFPRYAWYLVAGALMLLAALAVIRAGDLKPRDAGLTLNRPWVQWAFGLTGPAFGAMEYYILRPEPLASGLSLWEYGLLAFSIAFFTGFVEELIFRGILQGGAVKALGEKAGLLGVASVFAVLHMGWLSMLDMVFVFIVGLLFGFVVLKTGSIVGASISHGLTNVVLFMVMPYT
jgi:membrane protease YdiL (CAAX protease family)